MSSSMGRIIQCMKNTIHVPNHQPGIITLPILDTLQKNDKFFAGERRYSHEYQKTS